MRDIPLPAGVPDPPSPPYVIQVPEPDVGQAEYVTDAQMLAWAQEMVERTPQARGWVIAPGWSNPVINGRMLRRYLAWPPGHPELTR